MPTTSSNTSPSFLQLSAKTRYNRSQKGSGDSAFCEHTSTQERFSRVSPLTEGDGVDLALDLERAICALENVRYLLQLCVADYQVSGVLLVFLKRQGKRALFAERRPISPCEEQDSAAC